MFNNLIKNVVSVFYPQQDHESLPVGSGASASSPLNQAVLPPRPLLNPTADDYREWLSKYCENPTGGLILDKRPFPTSVFLQIKSPQDVTELERRLKSFNSMTREDQRALNHVRAILIDSRKEIPTEWILRFAVYHTDLGSRQNMAKVPAVCFSDTVPFELKDEVRDQARARFRKALGLSSQAEYDAYTPNIPRLAQAKGAFGDAATFFRTEGIRQAKLSDIQSLYLDYLRRGGERIGNYILAMDPSTSVNFDNKPVYVWNVRVERPMINDLSRMYLISLPHVADEARPLDPKRAPDCRDYLQNQPVQEARFFWGVDCNLDEHAEYKHKMLQGNLNKDVLRGVGSWLQ